MEKPPLTLHELYCRRDIPDELVGGFIIDSAEGSIVPLSESGRQDALGAFGWRGAGGFLSVSGHVSEGDS